MTLKKNILTGYGVAFLLMMMVIAWAVINLVSLGKASEAILRENYRSILAAEKMIDALKRQDRGLLLISIDNDENGILMFREGERIFLEWFARAKDNITVHGEAETIQVIEQNYNTYRSFIHYFEKSKSDLRKPSELRGIYQKSVYPVFEKVYRDCIHLRNLNENVMYSASNRARNVASRAIFSTVLVAVSALVVALIFSLFLSERISRPLREFMAASRRIGSGDYKVQIPVYTSDELGRLADEFNQMAAQLEHFKKLNIEKILSEKNKSEAILTSIEDGIIVFDNDLSVVSINDSACRIFGLDRSGTRRLSCSEILQQSSVCALIEKTVNEGKQPEIPDDKRIIAVSLGGQMHHYLYSITTIKGGKKQLSGIVLLLKDVSRLKEVERLKSEFVMSASHELRTPLTSIGMSIDLLLEHKDEEFNKKDFELLKTAQEEVRRLKALVNDLLDLSKIEMGRIQMDFENVPVYPLIDRVQYVFRGQVDEKSVSLNTASEKGLPLIRADANKIIWVLTNLISNALRYVKAGGKIDIKVVKDRSQVRFEVVDDGPGIPPEYHSKIFQKFVKVEGREEGGTGLGLAICKEIVNAHGGNIWVESISGKGSTFIFTLPAVNQEV